ncbi:hypothetical protein BDD12DRAFT_250810 [Trichophaea hybrida]|nr:hypothetical protein BDD12DRAFT_250810 [Trichophaea hybrida]
MGGSSAADGDEGDWEAVEARVWSEMWGQGEAGEGGEGKEEREDACSRKTQSYPLKATTSTKHTTSKLLSGKGSIGKPRQRKPVTQLTSKLRTTFADKILDRYTITCSTFPAIQATSIYISTDSQSGVSSANYRCLVSLMYMVPSIGCRWQNRVVCRVRGEVLFAGWLLREIGERWNSALRSLR